MRTLKCKNHHITPIDTRMYYYDNKGRMTISRKYGTTGPTGCKSRHKPDNYGLCDKVYVAPANRGLLHCGNRAAYNTKGTGRYEQYYNICRNGYTQKQHKAAIKYPDRDNVVEFTIKNTPSDIKRAVKKIARQAPGPVEFCYEAGVCGFSLKRRIEALGFKCAVIAPSLVPVKPGVRIKTDRRDAKKLQEYYSAGLLTEVHAPNEKQEADRELVRLRETARKDVQRAQHHILKFLNRHSYIYHQGNHWTDKHITWLRGINFEEPALNEVFEAYFAQYINCCERLDRCDRRVEALAETDDYREMVGILSCFHGIKTITAISILVEIFDFARFESAPAFMSYLGLTPKEDSSGESEKKGPITKAGNKRVRRLLNETAHHYRHRYVPSKALKKRRESRPQWGIEIADRAGQRLSYRHRYLRARGKILVKANIAVARELAGFIWFTATQYYARKQAQPQKV
ncbi:IS110 family transposase [Limihaloglobus sulfuriphilus]|uniref:IS110 family transposase n=1 Tax=Limihaloglobus sulfuriphilus TaxID=1851148 RepID=UPI0011BA728B|nr:IS110 family transposase [Limihaloglobus sulfuriphilus]